MCLYKAVATLVKAERKLCVWADILISMLAAGDTLPKDIQGALTRQGLIREAYMQKGGAPFYLFQEHKCKLVIKIKLTNHEGQDMVHFVAWDGKVIHDQPYSLKVKVEPWKINH